MQRLLLFLFITSKIFAQSTDPAKLKWDFRGPANLKLEGKSITDIAADPNDPFENTIWGVTASGQVVINREIRKPDSRWSELPIAFDVKKIVFQSNAPNVVFAVLNSQKFLLKSTDGGKTWSNVAVSEISNNLIENLKISQRGRLVIALSNGTFMYSDNGGEVWVNANVVSFNNIANFWVGDNNKIYIKVQDDIYSTESPYVNWQKIDLDQALSEGFIAKDTFFEQFSSYVTDKGIYYGFVPNRRRIIASNKTFSSDAGVTFRSYNFPANTKEVVFAGEELIFATSEGIFLRKNANDFPLEPRNNGIETEFKMATVRDISGDDFIQGITTKNLFTLRNISSNYGIIYPNQLSEYRFIRDFESTTYLGNSNYIELKVDNKLIYPAEEIIPINNTLSYIRYDRNGLKKIVQYNTEQNNIKSESVIAPDNSFYSKSAVDIVQNIITKSIAILFSDGSIALVKNPSLYKNSFAQFTAISTPLLQNAAYIVPLSDTDRDWLIGTKNGEMYYTNDTGQSWKNTNNTSIKNLTINHLAYSTIQKTLFLATSNGIWIGQDIFGANPKWTEITKDFTEKSFNHVLYRERDGLIVATNRQKGIYTTNWFVKPNTIITQTPIFINSFPLESYNTDGARETTKVCTSGKINVPFATDLPQDGSYEFTVDLLRNDAQNTKIITLNGKSSKNPVEIELPSNLETDYYRFRVNAVKTSNDVLVSGIQSHLISLQKNQNDLKTIDFSQNIYCQKDSIQLANRRNPNDLNNPYVTNETYNYRWYLNDKELEKRNQYFLMTKQTGIYKRIAEMNGCIFDILKIQVGENLNINPSIFAFDYTNIGALNNWFSFTELPQKKFNSFGNIKRAGITLNNFEVGADIRDNSVKILKNGSEVKKEMVMVNLYGMPHFLLNILNEVGTYQYELKRGSCEFKSEIFRIGRKIQNQSLALRYWQANSPKFGVIYDDNLRGDSPISFGLPDAKFEWYRNDKLIQSKTIADSKYKDNYQLIIGDVTDVTLDLDGIYQLKISTSNLVFESLPFKVVDESFVLLSKNKRCEGIMLSGTHVSKYTYNEIKVQWYLDGKPFGVQQSGTNQFSILAKQIGEYKAVVTRDIDGKTLESAIIKINPSDFLQSPKILNDTKPCMQETTLRIDDDNLLQFDNYQWYKNGRQLVGDTLPFLKVRESGEYSLKMKVD
ncbi:MAG: hypothetical protein MUF45_15280, partial [Spirosomaceae bacterium]|nr:hypothetical protein [Spirosomataceae bacterium]